MLWVFFKYEFKKTTKNVQNVAQPRLLRMVVSEIYKHIFVRIVVKSLAQVEEQI